MKMPKTELWSRWATATPVQETTTTKNTLLKQDKNHSEHAKHRFYIRVGTCVQIYWNSQNSENNREKEKNCIRNIWNESPKNCSDRKKKKLLEAILLLLLSAYQLAAHYTIRAGKKKSRNKFSESVAASIRAVHALWMGFFWCLLSFFFSALPITISPPSRYTIFITLWKPAINFNSHDRTKMPKLPYTRTTTIWTLNNALNKNKKESPFSTYRFDWVSYIFYKIATFFVRLLWCV